MRTIEKTVYTIQELKSIHPIAYSRAIDKLRTWQYEDNYTCEEICSSLKKLIAATNYALRDYSIGESNSYIKLSRENTDDISGRRAFAWLENNLLSQFRIPWRHARRKEFTKFNQCYTDKTLMPYFPGNVSPAPFTGLCYDDDFIDDLKSSLRSGMTVRDSLLSLADHAQKLINDDIEYRTKEEYLIEESDSNNREYDESGDII